MSTAIVGTTAQAPAPQFGSGPRLTEDQVAHFKSALVKPGTPVRFLHNGGALNIITGHVQPRGINVIYQQVYWNFARETALEIARLLNVSAVFSE
jgi:hypothetical protein